MTASSIHVSHEYQSLRAVKQCANTHTDEVEGPGSTQATGAPSIARLDENGVRAEQRSALRTLGFAVRVSEVAIRVDVPALPHGFEIRGEAPLVGFGRSGVRTVRAFEQHAALVVAEAGNSLHVLLGKFHVGQRGEFIDLRLDGFLGGRDLLHERGDDGLDRRLGKIPEAGKLEHVDAVLFAERAELMQLFIPRFHPPGGPEGSMISTSNCVAAGSTSEPGHGSKGLRMIMAQSSNGPKRSKLRIRSSVKPLAGPGAMPMRSVSFASRSESIAVQTTSLV